MLPYIIDQPEDLSAILGRFSCEYRVPSSRSSPPCRSVPVRRRLELRPTSSITFNADPGKLPFDPYGARLGAARQKLAEVVGRKVALELDVALVREYRAWFETGLVTAVENAAHDLGELKRTRSEAWTAMFSKLGALSLRYDAAAQKVGVRLEADRETVEITVPAKSTSFLPHEAALLALEAQYDAGLPERYADGVPATVSVAEKRAYFRALTGQKPPPLKPGDPATARGVANDVRPTAIARATRFYDVAMPQDLKAEIHEWLLTEGNYFRDGYLLYPDVVKTAPPTSAFRRAETAWVDWTQKNADRFTDWNALRSPSWSTSRRRPRSAWPVAATFHLRSRDSID